nr:hypothetical protein CFP56_08136 [Quercus suber]
MRGSTAVSRGPAVRSGDKVRAVLDPGGSLRLTEMGTDFVRITPIITRHDGVEMAELGAGGGKGDLDRCFELEINDPRTVEKLMTLCAETLSSQPQVVTAVRAKLQALMRDGVEVIELDAAALRGGGEGSSQDDLEMGDLDQLPIEKLVPALVEMVKKPDDNSAARSQARNSSSLPRTIVRLFFRFDSSHLDSAVYV